MSLRCFTTSNGRPSMNAGPKAKSSCCIGLLTILSTILLPHHMCFYLQTRPWATTTVQTAALPNTFIPAQFLPTCHLHQEHATSLSGISSVTGDLLEPPETTDPPLASCIGIFLLAPVVLFPAQFFVDYCFSVIEHLCTNVQQCSAAEWCTHNKINR